MSDEYGVIWKDIPDYEGLYKVSSHGDVMSLDRTLVRSCGTSYKYKGRVLKQKIVSHTGYKSVTLCNNGEHTQFYVHRLVASAFLPNSNNYKIINHKNGDRSYNNTNNLEWCTHRQNTNHALDIGLMPHGELCKMSKLTEKQVGFIRLSEKGPTELSKILEVSPSTICDIRAGRTWRRHG